MLPWAQRCVLSVQQAGRRKLAVPSVNPARLENMAMLWERAARIVRLVATGRLTPMLKHVQHVHWDTHKTMKVKHHGEYLFSFLFLCHEYLTDIFPSFSCNAACPAFPVHSKTFRPRRNVKIAM